MDGYQDNFATIRENIEIAIIGSVIQDGEIKTLGFWATTDEDGYFGVTNVPQGDYAIKGFRTRLIGLGDIIIENELIDPQRNYFELKNYGTISFSGRLFCHGRQALQKRKRQAGGTWTLPRRTNELGWGEPVKAPIGY